MATIYNDGGEPIAEATLELPVNGTTAQLRGLPRSNGLLQYYFVQGGRKVQVDTPDGRVEGRLNTRWERFGRAWEVTLLIPAAPTFRPEDSAAMDQLEGKPAGRAPSKRRSTSRR